MPHADSSLVPEEVKTKAQFYAHVQEQLSHLLEGSTYWVSNLAQTSSLLYHSYLSTDLFGTSSTDSPLVNWVGFYIQPSSSSSTTTDTSSSSSSSSSPLLVGPYNGRPACVVIKPIKGKGVCADAFVDARTVIVEDVDEYPGHIACDGDTRSEIVVPLRIPSGTGNQLKTAGVLDLDSTARGTFDEEDQKGLEGIMTILANACDWGSL
ncbi:GAF domain-like protein [Naematelia encephala]|uniref:GAF domain-like protein n=1 Tax=Naematelia encephala TaxID=71784 RepID=A0A1Y2B6Y0_9TREE|nr:GAF domain-like protein [Naematelia encephala]